MDRVGRKWHGGGVMVIHMLRLAKKKWGGTPTEGVRESQETSVNKGVKGRGGRVAS